MKRSNEAPDRGARGFAALSSEKRREVARAGGVAVHAAGTAHKWAPDEARAAGRLGGLARAKALRAKAPDPKDAPFLRAAYVAGVRVDDVLRDVWIDGPAGHRLTVWSRADGRCAATGQELLAYELRAPSGKVLFAGSDFGASPCHAVDADETLRGLLGFLTLRPGDTDADYFEAYTPEQLAFARGDAESLSMYADDEGPAFVDV
jgi:general stress protein YciG